MASNSYYNPQSVAIGSTSITGVLSISWNTGGTRISGAADGETHESIGGVGDKSTSVTIAFRDAVQAATAAGLSGTLVATLAGVAGSASKTLTISGVVPLGDDNSVGRNAMGQSTVPYVASLAAGTTPVAIT